MQLHSLEDTQKLAKQIITSTKSGDLLILTGPLGAGKTTLTQELVKLLESPARATSPTYTLIHEYPSPEGTIIHIDAYRLKSAHDLLELGLEDYLDYSRLVIVKWGEALVELFPDAKQVVIRFDNDVRIAEFRST